MSDYWRRELERVQENGQLALLDVLIEQRDAEFVFPLIWEGNYWEEEVRDYSEVSERTLRTLIRKTTWLFREPAKWMEPQVVDEWRNRLAHPENFDDEADRTSDAASPYFIENSGGFGLDPDDRVALLLPHSVQLILCVLAAMRANVRPIIIDASQATTAEVILQSLKLVRPKCVICMDAVWQGLNLIETKSLLDEALARLEKRFVDRLIVIRHVGPTPGIPPPEIHLRGRRPYYPLKVNYTPGRDIDWSFLFVGAEESLVDRQSSSFDKRESLAEVVELASSGKPTVSALGLRDCIRGAEKICELAPGSLFCYAPVSDAFLLFSTCFAALAQRKPLVVYEGSLEFPDPARVFHLVNDYEISSLILRTDVDATIDWSSEKSRTRRHGGGGQSRAELYGRLVSVAALRHVLLISADGRWQSASANLRKALQVAAPNAKIVEAEESVNCEGNTTELIEH